jgi:hypothetical protein
MVRMRYVFRNILEMCIGPSKEGLGFIAITICACSLAHGIENLNVKFGHAAVAFIGVARPDVITQNGNLTTSHLDARLYDVKGPLGLWGGWFDYATSKGGHTPSASVPGSSTVTNIPSANGFAYGIRHRATRVAWPLSHADGAVWHRRGKQLQRTWNRDDNSNATPRYCQIETVSGHRTDCPAAKRQVCRYAHFSVSVNEKFKYKQ